MRRRKTKEGTNVTAKRIAAYVLSDCVERCYYFHEEFNHDLNEEELDEIFEAMDKIIGPFRERMDNIARDVTTEDIYDKRFYPWLEE